MGISPQTVKFLQELGHQATHLQQEGLSRLDDTQVLAKACSEGRILITHDLDFGDLLAASVAPFPSVIILRLRNMSPHQVNHYLQTILKKYENELLSGVVMSISGCCQDQEVTSVRSEKKLRS